MVVAGAIPGGMSKNAVARVTNNGTFAITVPIKGGIADFLSSGVLPGTEVRGCLRVFLVHCVVFICVCVGMYRRNVCVRAFVWFGDVPRCVSCFCTARESCFYVQSRGGPSYGITMGW